MSMLPKTDSMTTGPADDTPVPDRDAGIRPLSRAWGDTARRSLKDFDSSDAISQELHRRRSPSGQ